MSLLPSGQAMDIPAQIHPQSPGTPEEGSAPPAYDNKGFEPITSTKDEKAGGSSLSSNDVDDTTATNTYINSVMTSDSKGVHDDDDDKQPVASEDASETTSTQASSGVKEEKKKESNPLTDYRHKDSTVGFKLPESSSRERRKSSVSSDQPYRGMGKEDLLRHSSKPFWRRLRYICMSVVMVGWLALIITVVALVLVYPRCRSAPDQSWWKRAVVYRVYVPSFQDSNDDGVGDLKGVEAQLDYLQEIGVNTLSLSPIFPTDANSDSDTAITNHTTIDPQYGDLGDFVRLVNASRARSIKVLLDFIPNHTGRDHVWFEESRNYNFSIDSKKNFYVWEESASVPPNNWVSVYDNSAWAYDSLRGQWYLHQFGVNQPDLNLRSSEVRDALQDILKFWLDLGVDGFYIRDSGFMFEDYDIRDENLLSPGMKPNEYASYNHTYTYGLEEVHDMFARWRAYLDDYGNRTSRARLLFADRAGEISEVMQYYGYFNRDGVNFPLNTFCLDNNFTSSGTGIAKLVQQWMKGLPNARWANWLGGTDFSPRMIDRLGEQLMRPFLTLIMLLPGTPVVYYGDEIGMAGLSTQEVDKGQRNLSMRSPMQWNNDSNAGFCNSFTCEPWMQINPQYRTVNVKNQRVEFGSVFQLFTNLTHLRGDHNSFHYGDYHEAIVDDQVFSFVRDFDGEKGFLVALNFANTTISRDFQGTYATVPGEATVALPTGSDVIHKKEDKVSTSGLHLGPYQGVVLSWDYVAKEL